MTPIDVYALPASPWKNAAGITRTIAVSPPGASFDGFDWRISIAEVVSEAQFSRFPGVDRTILLLDGPGMILHIGGQLLSLTTPFHPHAFSGDDKVRYRLVNGATRDFNVMTRPGPRSRRRESAAISISLAARRRCRCVLLRAWNLPCGFFRSPRRMGLVRGPSWIRNKSYAANPGRSDNRGSGYTGVLMTKTILLTLLTIALASAQPPAGRGRGQRQDMASIARPIDMHDTVWIEDMTQLEVRDSLKAGKTTALVFAGGMEDNGPYVTVSQHNLIVHAMCDSIARNLGNALCAPIIGMSPGSPDRSKNPGSVVLSQDTFKAVAADIATSLKTEGFLNVMFMVDHGADAAPMQAAAKDLTEKWTGSGAAIYYVPEYYDYNEVEKFEHDVLGVTEKREGFHDDYYTASISVAIDPVEARMQERIKSGKTTINGVDLAAPKAVEDGKKIMAFREEAAVNAIRKLVSGPQR